MKTQEDFVRNLEISQEAVELVVDWLAGYGYDVTLLPHTVAPTKEERFQHMDQGDIMIRQRVEIKHRVDIDFQSVKDFPFDTIIVDEKYKIDKRSINTLHAYVIVNKSKTGCLVIPKNTYPNWIVEERFDSKEGAPRVFYLCPKSFAIFKRFPNDERIGSL
jgi:hypothetical protein